MHLSRCDGFVLWRLFAAHNEKSPRRGDFQNAETGFVSLLFRNLVLLKFLRERDRPEGGERDKDAALLRPCRDNARPAALELRREHKAGTAAFSQPHAAFQLVGEASRHAIINL